VAAAQGETATGVAGYKGFFYHFWTSIEVSVRESGALHD
jgi:hypothetical protein